MSKKPSAKPTARKLAGAVVLTATLSLFAIPDALAESCGSAGVSSIQGAMSGSDAGGGCVAGSDGGGIGNGLLVFADY